MTCLADKSTITVRNLVLKLSYHFCIVAFPYFAQSPKPIQFIIFELSFIYEHSVKDQRHVVPMLGYQYLSTYALQVAIKIMLPIRDRFLQWALKMLYHRDLHWHAINSLLRVDQFEFFLLLTFYGTLFLLIF